MSAQWTAIVWCAFIGAAPLFDSWVSMKPVTAGRYAWALFWCGPAMVALYTTAVLG